MWLPGGGIGISSRSGAVSPEYRIYALGPGLHPRFVHHLVRSRPYLDQYRLLIRAETTFDRRISKEDFRDLPMVVPPLAVQRAIADYLDYETARIDSLIAAKKRMVELLEERRRSFITRAVSPPSEVTGWHLMRLRHLVRAFIDTEHKTVPFYPDGEYLVIRTNNVSKGRLMVGEGSKYTDHKGFLEWTQRGRPEAGDMLFTREAPAGEACLMPSDLKGCVGQRTVLIKAAPDRLLPRYAIWALYGGVARSFIDQLSQGSTVAHFNMGDIGDIPIWTPTVSEQRRIALGLESRVATIDSVVATIDTQMRLLQEHRQALITAAVTGDLDIPDTA